MIKFRLYFDKDEETDWLNGMAKRGWAMKWFFLGLFWFEACEPGAYQYQIDFGRKPFSVDIDYRAFMEENGVEVVQPWGYWIILRRPASAGEFVLYTDVDSAIGYYCKIRKMFKAVLIIELFFFLFEIYCAVQGAAYVGTFIIGALVLVLSNAVIRTNRTIAQLQEQRGETPGGRCGRRVSVFLPCGMLLNSVALFMDHVEQPTIKPVIQIAACVLMMVGIYRTVRMRGL